MAGLVLATWSLERRRRQIDERFAKIYKINYKKRYFPIWDYASAEVNFAPAETSAVALGRRTRHRITTLPTASSSLGRRDEDNRTESLPADPNTHMHYLSLRP